MKKVYAEIGFGNQSFLSTEIESRSKEKRVDKFIKPEKVQGIYLRLWIFKRVLILSTYDGIKWQKRNKIRFKFLLGIQGVSR